MICLSHILLLLYLLFDTAANYLFFIEKLMS